MQQSMGSQRVRRDLATEQQQEVIFTSAGCSIHCRQGSIQHLDRRAVASSSPYCGSLTDDDCRITFKEVSPSVSLLPLFLIPVTPVSSLGSEQSFAHAFFFFFAMSISSLQVLPLSLFIHMVQLSSLNSVKFFLGIILCTLPSSLQAIQQSVLISASHYV